MADSSVLALTPYDATAAKELAAAAPRLSTFKEVAEWDRRAEEEVARIRRFLDDLSTAERRVTELETRAQEAHSSKGFLRRTLTTSTEAQAAAKWRVEASAYRQALSALIDQLEAFIEKTPNSREEQQEMLRELKLAKKELTLRKRETNEAMREIRTKARQRSARIPVMLFGTPKTRRAERIGLRLAKEWTVAPHESARTQIERQLLVIERAIHWIEKFK